MGRQSERDVLIAQPNQQADAVCRKTLSASQIKAVSRFGPPSVSREMRSSAVPPCHFELIVSCNINATTELSSGMGQHSPALGELQPQISHLLYERKRAWPYSLPGRAQGNETGRRNAASPENREASGAGVSQDFSRAHFPFWSNGVGGEGMCFSPGPAAPCFAFLVGMRDGKMACTDKSWPLISGVASVSGTAETGASAVEARLW